MNIHTSLSHSEDWLAFVVSPVGRVGIDIEDRRRAEDLPELQVNLCHPTEWQAISALPVSEQALALLSTWVRKEAYLKAAGVGLAIEMNTFCAEDQADIALSLAAPVMPGLVRVQTQVEMDFVAAIAVSVGQEVQWLRLRP